ncbi:MAG: hypothetical protein JXA09_18265 [Anaerolineae bacterium]|nr:hypothetical protein [Anaerolineae bacterium]
MKTMFSLPGMPHWAWAAATPAQAGPPHDPPGMRHLLAQAEGRSDDEERETVRAHRRRRTTPPGPEGRERADAPQRRRPAAQRQEPPSTPAGGRTGAQRPSTRPTTSGTGVPLPSAQQLQQGVRLLQGLGLPRGVIIGIGILLVICVVGAMILMGGRDGDQAISGIEQEGAVPERATATPLATAPVVSATPTRAPVPVMPISPSTEGQTWLVMLYQDADDKVLEQDIFVDLNEAERVGSTDRVQIVAQVDRYSAGYSGDGDWSTTKRFYVTRDDDLNRVGSELLADLGEVNMADGAVLVDFVTWAIQTFPADKHVLIMSDHGMGWPGGWSDAAPGGREQSDIPLASRLDDHLYLMEVDDALQAIRDRTGLQQFEVIGMDACLMGHLEVFAALAPHARYAIASQETEPALGWAYTKFLSALTEDPDMTGAELGQRVVESYIRDDQRILDEEARNEMLGRGAGLGGLFGLMSGPTAEQMAQQMEREITLAAIDLAALPELMASVNDLAYVLQGADQAVVARARTYARSFTSVFGKDVPPAYVDLGSFAQLAANESGDPNVVQAVERVLAALDASVVAERHGPGKEGATGVSVYWPNSDLYKNTVTGAASYTAVARRFAAESLWDDLLAYHYTGRAFERSSADLVVPERGAEVGKPGAGRIALSPVRVSAPSAAPGRPVLLSMDVEGQNIGHIYLFVGYLDAASNSIFVADMDYLESDRTREVDGVYYPVWSEGDAFTIEFEWEPFVYAIDDGTQRVVAALKPESFGALPEDAVYSVDGSYTFADDGTTRQARLYFRDGVLYQAFGFAGDRDAGAPREIIPRSGDAFTVLETWMDLDPSGGAVRMASQEGGTLTFGDQVFAWRELDAAPGDYVVGFIVEDLDGARYEAYGQVRVE